MTQTRLEKDTKQARKWHQPGSKMAQTRLESGTNQARKWHKLGSKIARTRHEKSRNQHEKSFNSFVLGSKLGTQNGSNQGTMEESMLHKRQATPCASPDVICDVRTKIYPTEVVKSLFFVPNLPIFEPYLRVFACQLRAQIVPFSSLKRAHFKPNWCRFRAQIFPVSSPSGYSFKPKSCDFDPEPCIF